MAEVNIMNGDFSEAYWRNLHHKATIAAMTAMLGNPTTFDQLEADDRYKKIGDKPKVIAIASLIYADELVEKLRESDEAHGWTEENINEELLMKQYHAAGGK